MYAVCLFDGSFQRLQLSIDVNQHFLQLTLGVGWHSGTIDPSLENFHLPTQLDKLLQAGFEAAGVFRTHIKCHRCDAPATCFDAR